MYPTKVTCRNCPDDPFAVSSADWKRGNPGDPDTEVTDVAGLDHLRDGADGVLDRHGSRHDFLVGGRSGDRRSTLSQLPDRVPRALGPMQRRRSPRWTRPRARWAGPGPGHRHARVCSTFAIAGPRSTRTPRGAVARVGVVLVMGTIVPAIGLVRHSQSWNSGLHEPGRDVPARSHPRRRSSASPSPARGPTPPTS